MTATAAAVNAGEALVLKHSYQCSPETLFDAWLNPETVRQFMCPGPFAVGRLDWDSREGGEFFVEMCSERPEPHPHSGRFIEVKRPRRIVFTWTSEHAGKDTLVTLDFEPAGERTVLTLTHERLPQAMVAAHRGGWTSILEKAGKALGA